MAEAKVQDEKLATEFMRGFNETLDPQAQLYRIRIKLDSVKLYDEVKQSHELMEKVAEFIDNYGGSDLSIKITSFKPKKDKE